MQKTWYYMVMLFAVVSLTGSIAPPTASADEFKFVLSSGLFSLPAAAQSVDWATVNDSPTAQTVRVTVFKAGVGAKTVVDSLTFTLDPGFATHNANSVGFDQPFVPGFYYEVVVEVNNRKVLSSVQVWQDHANTVIPGTLISPGDFVKIK